MSEEPTKEQILEVMDRTKHGTISFWAWQELIEDASGIAFKHLVKEIVKQVRSVILMPGQYETAMTLISIAGITREVEDIRKARECVNEYPFSGRREKIIALLGVADITHESRDIDPVRKVITEDFLNGYHLIKANLLIARVDGKDLDLSVCEKASTINDPYLRIKALAEIRRFPNKKEQVERYLDNAIAWEDEWLRRGHFDSDTLCKVLAVKLDISLYDSLFDRAYSLAAKLPNDELRAEGFAMIAFFSKDPDPLERAYLSVKEIDKVDPNRGASAWRLLVRVLAGID